MWNDKQVLNAKGFNWLQHICNWDITMAKKSSVLGIFFSHACFIQPLIWIISLQGGWTAAYKISPVIKEYSPHDSNFLQKW